MTSARSIQGSHEHSVAPLPSSTPQRGHWILGGAKADLALLLLPGWLALGWVWVAMGAPGLRGLWFPLVVALDGSHVMATLWRTHLTGSSSPRHRFYRWGPLGLFLSFLGWQWAQLPHLWTLLAYAVLFHQVRQAYGVLRWYEGLAGRSHRAAHGFLYALTLLPIALAHVSPSAPHSIFVARDLLPVSPWPPEIRWALWGALLGAWLVYEWVLWRRGEWALNRFLAIASPAGVFGVGFLGVLPPEVALVPFVVAHGLQYHALIERAVDRIEVGPPRSPARRLWVPGASLLLSGAVLAPLTAGGR